MGVSRHTPNHRLLLDVPDLHLAIEGAHAQVAAALTPGDRRDSVALAEVHKLGHARCIGVPYEDSLSEGDSQGVLLRPVHEVEVEVVAEVGSVEDSEGHRSYLSDLVDEKLRVARGRSSKKLAPAREIVKRRKRVGSRTHASGAEAGAGDVGRRAALPAQAVAELARAGVSR